MKNRIIKFRVWDRKYKIFLEATGKEFDISINLGGEVLAYDGNDLYELDADEQGEILNTLIVEQFTGLTDKNGKEIFEGDILKGRIVSSFEKEQIVTVVFNEGSFDIENRSISGFCLIEIVGHNCEGASCEVIGNIHENLELLTKK